MFVPSGFLLVSYSDDKTIRFWKVSDWSVVNIVRLETVAEVVKLFKHSFSLSLGQMLCFFL